MASEITGLTIVYSTVYSGADQRKHKKLRLTGLCAGIHRWPVNSPHKGPVTRKMFPFDDVIMTNTIIMKKEFGADEFAYSAPETKWTEQYNQFYFYFLYFAE